MTEQKIFDKVAQHLLKQNEKARDLYGSCKYRLQRPDGRVLKCAVGCLIEDGEYRSWMEDHSVYALLDEGECDHPLPERLQKLFSDNVVFLGELQDVHDTHEPVEWPDELRKFAAKHGLRAGVLHEVAK